MASFATAEDVERRMGRALSDSETDVAEMVIETVSGLIVGLVGEDDDWADALDPVPPYFRALCVEKVVTVLSNPEGLASFSEQLGEYQHSGTYPRASDIGLFLSDSERREVRRALGGTFRAVTIESPYSGSDTSDLDFAEFQ